MHDIAVTKLITLQWKKNHYGQWKIVALFGRSLPSSCLSFEGFIQFSVALPARQFKFKSTTENLVQSHVLLVIVILFVTKCSLLSSSLSVEIKCWSMSVRIFWTKMYILCGRRILQQINTVNIMAPDKLAIINM